VSTISPYFFPIAFFFELPSKNHLHFQTIEPRWNSSHSWRWRPTSVLRGLFWWHKRALKKKLSFFFYFLYLLVSILFSPPWASMFFYSLIFVHSYKINQFNMMIFFFCNPGCPGQLTRTTTNSRAHWTSCKPSEHVRHRGNDKCAQWNLNPDAEKGNKPLPPLGYNLKCNIRIIIRYINDHIKTCFYWNKLLIKNLNQHGIKKWNKKI